MSDTDHARCAPGQHSRDISAGTVRDTGQHAGPVTLRDGRRILVMRCNDCDAPLFYCDADGSYHHLGAGIAACFLVQEESWPLTPAGFSTEQGSPEPG